MKTLRIIPVFAVFVLSSCSKPDKYTPPVDNDELIATLSIDGATPFTYFCKGDEVSFSSEVSYNGEKRIGIVCSKNNMNLHFDLRNVNPPGTFNFGFNSGPEPAECLYTEGNSIDGFSNYYSTNFQQASGTISIDSFSTTYISGTFNVVCVQPPDYKILEITAGRFKGNF